MKLLFISFFLVAIYGLIGCGHKKPKKDIEGNEYALCPTAKEYITTLEYLRSVKELGASEQQGQQIANKVAKGCEGAAKRFIKVSRILMKAELGSRDSINTAIEFANSDDHKTKTFLTVFKVSFLKSYLDLDLGSSIKTAKSLSLNYKHDDGFVAKDFQDFVGFCTNSNQLDLPKPTCARFSRRLASVGYKYKEPVFKGYKKTFKFLVSEKGPRLTTDKALKFAEKIVMQGPNASENFIAAFQYGSSKKGLKLSFKDALKFADNISVNSKRSVASEKK